MEDGKGAPMVVRLNEVVDVIKSLAGGDMRNLLGDRVTQAAGCTGLCDCNVRYCKCNGSVSALTLGDISFPDFLKLREAKIADLRRQLEELEIPEGLAKQG